MHKLLFENLVAKNTKEVRLKLDFIFSNYTLKLRFVPPNNRRHKPIFELLVGEKVMDVRLKLDFDPYILSILSK